MVSQAIDYAKRAAQKDDGGHIKEAYSAYVMAIEHFMTALKYEKIPQSRELMTKHVNALMNRAEQLKIVLQQQEKDEFKQQLAIRACSMNTTEVVVCKTAVMQGEGITGSEAVTVPALVSRISNMSLDYLNMAMDSTSKAVEFDSKRQFSAAYEKYIDALDIFQLYLEEKRGEQKTDVMAKMKEILTRAEELKRHLDKVNRQTESRPYAETAQVYVDFTEQAADMAQKAIRMDQSQQYPEAYRMYLRAVEFLDTSLKYTASNDARSIIKSKIAEYTRRAEEIRSALKLSRNS